MADYYNPAFTTFVYEDGREVVLIPAFQQRVMGSRKFFSIKVSGLNRIDVDHDMINNPRVVLVDLLKLFGITKVSRILKPDLARLLEERFRFS